MLHRAFPGRARAGLDCGGAEFPELRILLARDRDGAAKVGLRFGRRRPGELSATAHLGADTVRPRTTAPPTSRSEPKLPTAGRARLRAAPSSRALSQAARGRMEESMPRRTLGTRRCHAATNPFPTWRRRPRPASSHDMSFPSQGRRQSRCSVVSAISSSARRRTGAAPRARNATDRRRSARTRG